MGGQAGDAARLAADPRLAAAHRALLDDPGVQFTLTASPKPPTPPELPAWLRHVGHWLAKVLRPVAHAIGRLFGWLGRLIPHWPFASILLWAVIALFAVTMLWMAAQRIRHGEWRWPRWRRRRHATAVDLPADEPAIDLVAARAWLQEADALAALGRFAEAVHLLLFRSVEDLAKRRPGVVRPALTSRELAGVPAFPPAVRERFAGIAALVERSLFGGRSVDADDWTAARARYAELAQPGAWRA